MSRTMSLEARAEGRALCKAGGMSGTEAREGLMEGKMGNAGVRQR